MGVFELLLLAYLSPLLLVYFLLCFVSPFLRLGEVERGKGLKLYVAKDMIHSDYVFESGLFGDLFEPKGRYVRIGWGDRKIFLETKTWSDLKISSLLSAFVGLNGTVLRVDFMDEVPVGSSEMDLNERQLEVIKIHVMDSYRPVLVAKKPSDHPFGDYYESDLRYNCITNCNNWVNRGLFMAKLTDRIWCPFSFFL
jgi:hypothetical protein